MSSMRCTVGIQTSGEASSNVWNIEIDSDNEDDSAASFLPNRSNSTSNPTASTCARRGRSTSMFQVVVEKMRNGKRGSGNLAVNDENGTPSSVRRAFKSPATKRKIWSFSRHWEKQSETRDDAKLETAACLVSDGPNYLFKMAANGNVKQISDVCNAQPERMLSQDPSGATVMHHAAAHGKTRVMDYILADQNGSTLLDARDNTNATPLHWAVIGDNSESIEYLISRGADPTLLNDSSESPLHTSVRKNCLDALRALIKHKGIVNLNQQKSNSGVTALHMAASADNTEAAKLLMAGGAKVCMACFQGYRPLHAAALSGSKGVMEIVLEKCQQFGYSREQILSFNDKELCSPLHCAVLGGNQDTIKMCLNYGAKLDKPQAELTTPMHLVCAQGAFEIVKIMFELARKQATNTLSMQDKQKHTPLHKAAMYGHASIVKYLVEEGADPNMLDADNNSPLLLAASRGNWVCVRYLLELGADVMLKNNETRNFMHMIVLNGGDIRKLDLDEVKTFSGSRICEATLCKPQVQELLNQPDAVGCTPLHYACQEGNLASLETLMMLGVSARLKSAGNQSPLHFAARYGRFNACVKLINSSQGPNIINEKDDSGMTPLHFAAQNGHSKVVQLLLNKGAAFHRNTRGESALHVAAVNGYTRTMRILVSMNKTLLDQVDEDGDTALHHAEINSQANTVKLLLDLNASILRNKAGHTFFTRAIQNENREIALAAVEHDRWEEAMQEFYKNKTKILIPTLLLIQYLPDVWVIAQNRCVQTADCNPKSKDYWIKYQFKYLQPNVDHRDEIRQRLKTILKSEDNDIDKGVKGAKAQKGDLEIASYTLPALNRMVTYNRVECLRHPVSNAYLRMKWNAYGRWFHGLNLFIYMLGLVPLTYLVCTIDSSSRLHNHPFRANSTQTIQIQRYSNFQYAMMILITALFSGQIIKELVQIYQQRHKYFKDIANLVEWVLYVTTLLYVIPFYTGYPVHWQFECGAIAILLAWFNLLLFLQRFDIAGIYVVMFIEILHTLVRVLAVFSFLIIASGLSFYVLMQNEADKAWSTPPLSFMRVISMTLGEIGYTDEFLGPYVDGDDDTLHFSAASMVLLLVFVVVMPILLMNLLIGLAVGDIAQVQNNAALQRLAMQVQLHTEIEGKLSTRLLKLVDKDEVIAYPNRRCGFAQKLFGFVSDATGVMEDEEEIPESSTDRQINNLNIELAKQKERIKDIQTMMHKQHDLMKLIVQKMEIRSEADYQDEGIHPDMQKRLQFSRSKISSVASAKGMAIRAFKSISQ